MSLDAKSWQSPKQAAGYYGEPTANILDLVIIDQWSHSLKIKASA